MNFINDIILSLFPIFSLVDFFNFLEKLKLFKLKINLTRKNAKLPINRVKLNFIKFLTCMLVL